MKKLRLFEQRSLWLQRYWARLCEDQRIYCALFPQQKLKLQNPARKSISAIMSLCPVNMMTTKKFTSLLRIPVLAFLLALGIYLLLEIGARSTWWQSRWPEPHPAALANGLGKQWARLDWEQHLNGPVDCIIMGSSAVNWGMNVPVIEEQVREFADIELNCFNFGTGGMTPKTYQYYTEFILEHYQPKLIIYGTAVFEYYEEPEHVFMDYAWMRYHMGEFSFEGWLIEHSTFLRYFLFFNESNKYRQRTNLVSTQTGFDEHAGTADGEAIPVRIKPGRMVDNYELTEENEDIAGLIQILVLAERYDTPILVVELPMHDSSIAFEAETGGYPDVIAYIETAVTSRGVPFYSYPREQVVRENGFWDPIHLNNIGALRFSKVFGKDLGYDLLNGDFSLAGREDD